MTSFTYNDLLIIKKYKPFDLMRKMVYEGVKFENGVFFVHDNERELFIRLMKKEKFKNIKIDDNLIDLIKFTDNTAAERKLFYPAFFIDNDFNFDRFLVKGIFVFECHTIEKIDNIVGIQINDGIVNDLRIHFSVIDIVKDDFTDFGISIKDYGKYYRDQVLPSYQNEKDVIGELLDNIARIICNIIDMVEGNKDDLDIKVSSPTRHQNEKRIEKGLPLIPTVVLIKPKKQLLEYLEKFERDYRRSGYSHKFVVRGHWRYFRSEFYKSVHGQRIWIKPFIKGQGIFIKKDALVVN